MLKILTFILFLHGAAVAQHSPGAFYREYGVYQAQYKHLINMTESLCKDALYKLRMGDLIQIRYKGFAGYELGLLATGVLEKFRFMIKVYQYYSVAKHFKNETHRVIPVMHGYLVMQGAYNELLAELVLFYKVVEEHKQKDKGEIEEARVLAKKYKMSVAQIRALQKQGIDVKKMMDINRRSMPAEIKIPENFKKLFEKKGDIPRQLLLEDPMAPLINTWTPKKDSSNTQEEEYKKQMRYTKWAERWSGFNGETEGVHIADSIARLGLTNNSNFLLKELKGAV